MFIIASISRDAHTSPNIPPYFRHFHLMESLSAPLCLPKLFNSCSTILLCDILPNPMLKYSSQYFFLFYFKTLFHIVMFPYSHQDRQSTYNVTFRRVRVTTASVKKKNNINITYSVCVSVALVIQHATRMRHIANCGLPRYTISFHVTS